MNVVAVMCLCFLFAILGMYIGYVMCRKDCGKLMAIQERHYKEEIHRLSEYIKTANYIERRNQEDEDTL